MQHPSFQPRTPQPANNKPLCQSFIAPSSQQSPFQTIRVVNQPVFDQPSRNDQIMYKSSIQQVNFQTNNTRGNGLGRLESFGRTIR